MFLDRKESLGVCHQLYVVSVPTVLLWRRRADPHALEVVPPPRARESSRMEASQVGRV